jgi:hypothetical protein
MGSIFEHIGKELNWTSVKNTGYVLHVHDCQTGIAILQVQGAFGSKAEGKCADGNWNFRRVGMLKNGISVQEISSGKELAVFKKKSLSNSILEFVGGKKVTVKRNALMTEYDLMQDSEILVSYRHTQDRPQVYIHPTAANTPELPLIVIFLGYLMIMQRIDANQNAPF